MIGAGVYALGRKAGQSSGHAAAVTERHRRVASLDDLHAAGVLNDEEYAAATRRLLEM